MHAYTRGEACVMEHINIDCLDITNLLILHHKTKYMTVQIHWALVSSCFHLVILHHYFLEVYDVLYLIRWLYFLYKQLYGPKFALLSEVMVQNVCDLKR